MARLLLSAVLAIVLATSGALAAPSICAYDPSGYVATQWSGYCGPNPEWLVTQKAYAPLAKVYLQQIKSLMKCSSYDLSAATPAAFQKCLADKANGCYVDGKPGAWQCVSNSQVAFVASGSACKGSVYAEYSACTAKYKDECSGDCVWQPQLGRNYTQYQEYNKASGGFYDTSGYCFPAKYTGKFTTPAQFGAFVASLSPDPSNAAEYARIRGTCQYAKDGAKRFQYDRLCNSYNNPADSNLGLMLGSFGKDGAPMFTGLNYTAATACLQAGCSLDYIPGTVVWGYGADYFSCATEATQRYALGFFGPQDTSLMQAVRVCSDPAVRYNKALCLSATL